MYDISLDESSSAVGLTLLDLYHLTEPHKEIINWIRYQGDCSLLDIAVHFCQDEETVLNNLNALVEKGFLYQIQKSEEIYYRVRIASRRTRQVPDKLKNLLKKKQET